MYPDYTSNERLADGVIHVLGMSLGLVGFWFLLTTSLPSFPGYVSATILVYGLAMLIMLFCSAAYHMVPKLEWKCMLRRFDQAAIFIKIAGTYTPFALLKLGGSLGFGLLTAVWMLAILGAGLIFFTRERPGKSIVFLYLGLGWIGVLIVWPLMTALSTLAFAFLIGGGVLYTLGVLFYVWESLPFQNVIWHVFVLIATISHYAAVFVSVFVDGI